jgi:hypothetical protein
LNWVGTAGISTQVEWIDLREILSRFAKFYRVIRISLVINTTGIPDILVIIRARLPNKKIHPKWKHAIRMDNPIHCRRTWPAPDDDLAHRVIDAEADLPAALDLGFR